MIPGFSLAVVVDAVIALTVVEGLGLVAWHRLTGGGVAPRQFLANLLSGLCLMVGLRCAVHDTGAFSVMAALLAAGTAHLTDLILRWRRAPAADPHPELPAYPPSHRSAST